MNTGAAAKGPVEARLATKLREMSDRIRNLEHRRITNVGGWRLEENSAGDLVATHPTSGKSMVLCTLACEEV